MVIKSIFKKFDSDHSGKIEFPEFHAACYELGYYLSTSTLAILVPCYRNNARAWLECVLLVQNSWLNFSFSLNSRIGVEDAKVAFKHVDSDSGGSITQDEFLVGFIHDEKHHFRQLHVTQMHAYLHCREHHLPPIVCMLLLRAQNRRGGSRTLRRRNLAGWWTPNT